MLLLFFLSVAFSLIGFALSYRNFFPKKLEAYVASISGLPTESLSLGSLCITTASVVITSIYLSRNDRSIFHRYAEQERHVTNWIDGFLSALRSSFETSSASKHPNVDIAGEVLRFENIMIEEHMDWVHISSGDVLELEG